MCDGLGSLELGICNALMVFFMVSTSLLTHTSLFPSPFRVLLLLLICKTLRLHQQPAAPALLAYMADTPAAAPDSVQRPEAQEVRIPADSVPVEAGSHTGSAVALEHRGQMAAALAAVVVEK
jgi:hypothetical protein